MVRILHGHAQNEGSKRHRVVISKSPFNVLYHSNIPLSWSGGDWEERPSNSVRPILPCAGLDSHICA